MPALEPVSLKAIRETQGRLTETVLRTPLVRLNVDDSPAEIFLKLENLQPIGSLSCVAQATQCSWQKKQFHKGVWTASAGNMAQGVAWCVRQLGVECTVVVPEGAPETKIAAIQRLVARVVAVPYEDWLHIFRSAATKGWGACPSMPLVIPR